MKNNFTVPRLVGLCFGLLCFALFVSSQQKDLQTLRDDKQSDGYAGVALVIGNSDYQYATKLKSPVNDAVDIGKTLSSLGYKVLPVRADASLKEMDDAVAEFGRELAANKGVGIFYYSGHGVQSAGNNYLIPVDANIPLESFLKSRSLNTDVVLQTMANSTKGFKIVILDACRNNPFAKSWGYKSGDTGGLAGIYSAPRGMIIAYATSPNDTASDGRKRNSPYTEVLLQEMVKPGVRISEMFNDVRDILDKQTDGDQTPWESTSLVGKFCFAGCNVTSPNVNRVSGGTDSTLTETKPKLIQVRVKVLADNTSNGWTNSGWMTKKGQKIRILGSGQVSLGKDRYARPDGFESSIKSEKLMYDKPTGGLIAVIGDNNNEFIFIGSSREFVAQRDGALFLGVNEYDLEDNSGSFDVIVEIEP